MSAAAQPGLARPAISRRAVGEAVVAQTAGECERRYGSRLRAVILTGSLAREEATILASGARARILGDAEFLLVFRRGARLPAAAALDSLAESVARSLRKRNIDCAVHLAAVRPGYLARLPAHIFSYELRHAGRVVLGEADILRLAPAFTRTQIEREDAWRLLSNRLIEWLEARAKTAPGGDGPGIEPFYATVKLWMDAGTSLLVFLGQYEPSYAARAARLAALAGGAPPELPFPLAEFQAAVAEATAWKLRPAGTERPGWAWCDRARRFAARLWCWELGRMTGRSAKLGPLALSLTFGRRRARAERMRGWARAAREAGAISALRQLRRWLPMSRGGSPRDWIYAVAAEWALGAEGFSAAPDAGPASGPRVRTLRRFLPVPGPPAAAPEREWQALVRDLARNYHEFVERTRA